MQDLTRHDWMFIGMFGTDNKKNQPIRQSSDLYSIQNR